MTMGNKYQYLEIRTFTGNKVVKRIDVTGLSDSKIEKMDRGLNINLNHEEYYTADQVSSQPLPII